MHTSYLHKTLGAGSVLHFFVNGLLLAALSAGAGSATELGGSVYPVGVETVLPGMVPAPGASFLGEFNVFYQSNALVDGHGQNLVPGFHLRVNAFAVKFVHNWGVHALGGTLVSYTGVPFLCEHLDGAFGRGFKTGIGNLDVQPVAVAYQHGGLHWWYGLDVFAPGLQYKKSDLVNIGQHNFAVAPAAALTYMSKHHTEISSKVQYIDNAKNNQTEYRSGNEFIWEYDGMQNITRKLAIGVNGYYYQQTTDDLQFGLRVGDGNRGRDFAVGPEVRYHLGHMALIAKYQRDTLVQNRPVGNNFWLQLGIPIGHHE